MRGCENLFYCRSFLQHRKKAQKNSSFHAIALAARTTTTLNKRSRAGRARENGKSEELEIWSALKAIWKKAPSG